MGDPFLNYFALFLLLFVVVVQFAGVFLVFLIVWLFYCQCNRRGAIDPNGPVGQPLHYATADPHRVEGGKYPAFKPTVREQDMNDELPYPVPVGPLRGTLAPTQSASQLLQIKKTKGETPGGFSAVRR